jgi:3-isopropylmalate dehydratase small subunit
MVYLIHNICKRIYFKNKKTNKLFYFRTLKNQMTLIQTLSDNNQMKLDNNEQQIEEVRRKTKTNDLILKVVQNFDFSIEQK